MRKNSIKYVLVIYKEDGTQLKTEWLVGDFVNKKTALGIATKVATGYSKQGYDYAIFKETVEAVKFEINKEKLPEIIQ